MTKIAGDVTELIGNTPLVKINKLFPGSKATILAKLEFYNPASSVKDRIAKSIIDAAEASGDLKPGGTIVEATSGNTGVGLALVGAARGYKVIITMPETMSKERRAIIRLLGAELVLTPGADGVPGANAKAAEIVKDTPGAILASQFDNPANPQIHHDRTGEEIWDDTEGAVDAIVAGIGTGGTISGAGKYLKEKNAEVKVFGAEPAESPVITKGEKAPHKIQGWGPGFVPDNLDKSVVDDILLVSGEDAISFARRAAAEEGIITGISGGGALQAAGQVAARPGSPARRSSSSSPTPVSVTCRPRSSRASSTDDVATRTRPVLVRGPAELSVIQLTSFMMAVAFDSSQLRSSDVAAHLEGHGRVSRTAGMWPKRRIESEE